MMLRLQAQIPFGKYEQGSEAYATPTRCRSRRSPVGE